MKNVIKLDNYYSPDDLIKAIKEFVEYYNNERYHESHRNLTPADVYFGRDKKNLKKEAKSKRKYYRKDEKIISSETRIWIKRIFDIHLGKHALN